MIDQVIQIVTDFTVNLISGSGYFGIIIAMTIESALIPLPSEIIMPFSGYLVSTGRFNLIMVAVAGAIGNVIGSWIAYAIGYWGQETIVRRFIRKFGKYLLLTEHDLDLAENFLRKYGDIVILGSRVLPGVRTVISLPAGIAKLPIIKFTILTFIGSLIWSFILAYIGFILGENWHAIGPYFHKFDIFILVIILVLLGLYIYFKLKHNQSHEVS